MNPCKKCGHEFDLHSDSMNPHISPCSAVGCRCNGFEPIAGAGEGGSKGDHIRKQFEGCITEIGANKTLKANDDYNKGWNDASDNAIRFIRSYIKGEGLFQ